MRQRITPIYPHRVGLSVRHRKENVKLLLGESYGQDMLKTLKRSLRLAARYQPTQALKLNSLGIYNVPLNAAKLRQRAIRRICNLQGPGGAHRESRAVLQVTRRSFTHGERKVKVLIDGTFVGYLPAVTSMHFLRQAEHWGDHLQFDCAALIQGGDERSQGKRHAFVLSLDLPLQMDRFPLGRREAERRRSALPSRDSYDI